MADENKARILADGIEVWCAYDKLVKVEELIPHPRRIRLKSLRRTYVITVGGTRL